MTFGVTIQRVLKEITSLLYWTMLAACTVGPGTVVTCARAGAEYDLSLIWALIFASVLAYTLQEGTARLTIVSGRSLGQCLRIKYRRGCKIYQTAVICWLVAISVTIGNTLYECNNWAGGIDAILAIPNTDKNSVGLRVGCCIAYAVAVLLLLYWDKVDNLGIFLGVVMMSMVALFLVVVVIMGVDWTAFGWGFIPNIPDKPSPSSAEPSDIIISLVGTTSVGFNLFLGGAMANGRTLGSAQRGIAFSTIAALEVSVLILIVGAGTFQPGDNEFTISLLADLIKDIIGEVGVIIFAVGFIAAALSSMLAVPLGAGLAVESVFTESTEERDEVAGEGADNPAFGLENAAGKPEKTEDNTQREMPESPKHAAIEIEDGGRPLKTLPRSIYWAIIFVMVTIATITISANAPRVHVILVAQVFNGCLLPFFSICLLLCLNDQQLMAKSPQKSWANIFLLFSVTITLFLASNVIIQKLFGHLLASVAVKLIIACCIGLLIMLTLFFATSLGKDLLRSFSCCRRV